MQPSRFGQYNYFIMRNCPGVTHPVIDRQKLHAPPHIAGKQFAIDEIVPDYPIARKKPVQLRRPGFPAPKSTNPD